MLQCDEFSEEKVPIVFNLMVFFEFEFAERIIIENNLNTWARNQNLILLNNFKGFEDRIKKKILRKLQ